MHFKEYLEEATRDENDHIIMQLRSAQDLDGDKEIQFRRGKEKIDIESINKILAAHDKLQKPDQKRALRVLISKSAKDLIAFAKQL